MLDAKWGGAWLIGCALGLCAGCADVSGSSPSDVARFAAVVDRAWSRTADHLIHARFVHSATQLLDGQLLLVGGALDSGGRGAATCGPARAENLWLGSSPSSSAELFNPVTGVFEEVGALAQARWGHTATLLRDGRVLIAGGIDERDQALASAELYDPVTKSFVAAEAMNQARALQTATLLADDRVLLLGGIKDIRPFYCATTDFSFAFVQNVVVAQAEAYQSEVERFINLGTVPRASFPHAAVLLDDGRVASAWTQAPTPEHKIGQVSLQWFDPGSNQFSRAGEVNCQGQACGEVLLHYEAASLPSEAGARPASLNVVTWLEEIRLEPTTGNETREPHPRSPYFPLGGALMTFDSGTGPLIVGGLDPVAWAREPCATGANCKAAGWSSAAPLNYTRVWPTATSLVSGRVLVAGGVAPSNYVPLDKVEQGPAAIRSSPVTSLNGATGDGHAATLLSDGRVLFTGGGQLQTARAWSSIDADDQAVPDVGRILNQRRGHQGFLLSSGEVLLAGGDSTPDDANEELFNPSTGESRDLRVRLTARRSGLALGSDRFLFAGEDSVQLVDAGSGADVSVQDIKLLEPLGCATPGLARLLNGRIAVVGEKSVLELDPKQLALRFSPVALGTPRCDAAVTALPDGNLAIVGGSSKNDPDANRTFEIYRPATTELDSGPVPGRVSTARRMKNRAIGARALVRFSDLLLVGQDSQTLVNWLRSADGDADTETLLTGSLPPSPSPSPSPQQAVTTLADGGMLRVWLAAGDNNSPSAYRAERIEVTRTDASDLDLRRTVQTVAPEDEIVLSDLKLSKTWPENSGGSTHGSATNAPVAVWIPVLDGWPVTGTFTQWSEDSATWRVPHPAFPGLGALGYVLSGTFHPLRLVRISELGNGRACLQSSECESGSCADGVCCDYACDGACQACTAALTGDGADGVCGATPDNSQELACTDGRECRQGACQSNTECSTRADCAEGLVCNSTRQCEDPLPKPNTSIGCAPSCRVGSRAPATRELWALGLGLAGMLWRSSRRKSQRPISRSAP